MGLGTPIWGQSPILASVRSGGRGPATDRRGTPATLFSPFGIGAPGGPPWCRPRRDPDQDAGSSASLAAQNREESGEVDHRPCGAGGRHGRLRLPAPAAHLPGAGHRGSDPRWTAAEGVEACRCAREWTACLERPGGDLGASAIDTTLLREVRSRGRTVRSKAETDRRAAGVSTCLSGLCTEAAVVAGDLGRQGLVNNGPW
jgi:hypothetical protein